MNYNEFDRIYAGESDIASLTLRGPEGLYNLRFGGDGEYFPYFINAETVIPAHYTKETSFTYWCWIYDDNGRTLSIYAPSIEIYRAGERGCIIYAPGGRAEAR